MRIFLVGENLHPLQLSTNYLKRKQNSFMKNSADNLEWFYHRVNRAGACVGLAGPLLWLDVGGPAQPPAGPSASRARLSAAA